MRAQLIQYVELLFAGADNSNEIKQEILQNTLDKYDDMLDQGKSPEAAYRLAITGIGDINEILRNSHMHANPGTNENTAAQPAVDSVRDKNLRAIGIALYILCPVPLFIFGNTLGLSLLFAFVAAATALMIITSKSHHESRRASHNHMQAELTPQQELRRSIRSIISAIGLAGYLILSFATDAWYITWVLFPVIAAVNGLVNACFDLKEDK